MSGSWSDAAPTAARGSGLAFMVGVLRLRLHLPGCGTLKDKRHIIRGLNQKVRLKFAVAVAEIGELDRPGFCEIEVAGVANERAQVHRVLTAVSHMYESRPELDILDINMEL